MMRTFLSPSSPSPGSAKAAGLWLVPEEEGSPPGPTAPGQQEKSLMFESLLFPFLSVAVTKHEFAAQVTAAMREAFFLLSSVPLC